MEQRGRNSKQPGGRECARRMPSGYTQVLPHYRTSFPYTGRAEECQGAEGWKNVSMPKYTQTTRPCISSADRTKTSLASVSTRHVNSDASENTTMSSRIFPRLLLSIGEECRRSPIGRASVKCPRHRGQRRISLLKKS